MYLNDVNWRCILYLGVYRKRFRSMFQFYTFGAQAFRVHTVGQQINDLPNTTTGGGQFLLAVEAILFRLHPDLGASVVLGLHKTGKGLVGQQMTFKPLLYLNHKPLGGYDTPIGV